MRNRDIASVNRRSPADHVLIGYRGHVRLAAVLGTLRFLYDWSLKPLIYAALFPVLALTLYALTDPNLTSALGLAWDAGAVTTGPVTVPLVLALGVGIAAAVGNGDSGLSGFGIVTLASLFPIAGVFLLTLFLVSTTTPDEIAAYLPEEIRARLIATSSLRCKNGCDIPCAHPQGHLGIEGWHDLVKFSANGTSH